MLRTTFFTVTTSLIIAMVGTACSPGSGVQPPAELHPGPPVAIGEVCVDVTPADADATIMLNGEAMTERCQTTTTTYMSSASVIITAPGYIAQTHDVPLTGGSHVLSVDLIGPPAP